MLGCWLCAVVAEAPKLNAGVAAVDVAPPPKRFVLLVVGLSAAELSEPNRFVDAVVAVAAAGGAGVPKLKLLLLFRPPPPPKPPKPPATVLAAG